MLVGLCGLGLAMAASDGLLLSVGHAAENDQLATDYSLFNGDVAASADHVLVGTDADVAFGLVDTSVPKTRASVAIAGNDATATTMDTGPFPIAVLAAAGQPPPGIVQAKYPAGPENPPAYSAGPATASASTSPGSATAAATYGAIGVTSSSPPGSDGEGADGLTATATSYFDTSLGFVTVGDSRVHHASFGGGMLVLDDIHVLAKVSTDGSGHFAKSVSITVGSAYVNLGGNAIAVTIDQNGVTVAQQNLTPLDVVHDVSDQVNSALADAGVSVHTVAPVVTQQGDNLHLEAEGVVVDWHQKGTPDGVPHQYVRHTLGELVMDNEAVLAPPQPEDNVDLTPPDLGDNSSSSTTIINNVATGPAAAPPPAPPAATAPPVVPRSGAVPVAAVLTQPHSKRWLLFAYLAWQALMLALAGTLYLHRSARRRLA